MKELTKGLKPDEEENSDKKEMTLSSDSDISISDASNANNIRVLSTSALFPEC